MKIVLLFGLITIGVIIAFVLLFAAFSPRVIEVRSVRSIAVEPMTAYDTVRNQRHFQKWSPWTVTDPEQRATFTGTDGEVGSSFEWTGVKEPGRGIQTVQRLEPGRLIEMRCDIFEPYAAQPTFVYHFEPSAEGVEVVQDFTLEVAFPMNGIMRLMGLPKEMASTNMLGLERLQALLENRTQNPA